MNNPNGFVNSRDDSEEDGSSSVVSGQSWSSSSSMKISYSVNSQSEYGFTLQSVEKSGKPLTYVQQMRLKFEKISGDEELRQTPKFNAGIWPWTNPSDFGISEVPSEEEVDELEEVDDSEEAKEDVAPMKYFPIQSSAPDITVDEFESEQKANTSSSYQKDNVNALGPGDCVSSRFSEPLPRKLPCEAKNRHTVTKAFSYAVRKPTQEEDESTETDTGNSESHSVPICPPIPHEMPQIIKELISTELSYVETLKNGIRNYVNVFHNEANVPPGLKGKKYVLCGNVEQLAEFHENEFLPMLQRNQNDVGRLFEEFYRLIEVDCFYGYVLYAINKSRSENLCIQEKAFFRELQNKAGDKLGIDSFLVQPIQRLPRYPLLLNEMITSFFKSDPVKYKTVIGLCCRVEKSVRNLLETVNEAMQINDIEDCNDINLLYQGHFKRCNDFYTYDYSLRRGYKSKLFLFDRCIVYTEIIKDKRLIFRGYYPRERIGMLVDKKKITLYYQKRKVQECDFSADYQIIEAWIDLIKEMIGSFAVEERKKLKEKYKNRADEIYRRPGSVLLFRNSSRFSTDSGIASVHSVGSNLSDEASPRTTWYADHIVT